MNNLPFEVGALYQRRKEIHAPFGGQTQGGISTPAGHPFVFLFTGAAGEQHGYHDRWDDSNVFHYFGEGQNGDMQEARGNLAIREHLRNNKRLLLFQMMGSRRPVRFLGELRFRGAYEKAGVPDTAGNLRKAIVFMLEPVEQEFAPFQNVVSYFSPSDSLIDLAATSATQLVAVRTKQSLFRRRLLTVEKECRLTGIGDLRFLRASHIKPWSKCTTGDERVDGNNGLLLSPHADFLFDRGWISFEDCGALLLSKDLPKGVVDRIGMELRAGRDCGAFFGKQRAYLEFHRNAVFEKSFRRAADPLLDLLATMPP